MVLDDGERQPLLDYPRELHPKEESWLSSCISNIRSSWPVYQTVLLLFVYQVSYYGQVAAYIDIVRDLTCARYYERHPDLIASPNDDTCSSDLIESQSARILLVFELFVGLGSALSIIQYGKKFSTWGRKPVLIISLFSLIFFPLACVVLPKGYPYGPVPSEAILNPSTCIYILGATCIVTGLIGGNALPLCCYRLIVVDHSDTAERTKDLVFVMASYLLGIMIGPLISAAASYLFPISASGIDGALSLMFGHFHRSDSRIFTLPSNKQAGEHGIVTPFILAVLGGVFSIMYVIFFVKETAFSTQAAAEVGMEAEDEAATSHPPTATTDVKASIQPITPFRAIFPIKQKDGTYDLRITALFLTMVLVYCGASGLDIFILFFGHGMHWSPSSVGYLISSLGATRLVTVFVVLPPLLVFLERKIRRPRSIAHYTIEELHTISKASSSEETPIDESAFASERDLDHTRLLQGAISLWRARIDRSIVVLSWGTEVIGWFVIAIGATVHQTSILFFGNVLNGFGVGGQPSLQSFGLTVTSDVLAGAHQADQQDDEDEDDTTTTSHHKHAGEIFFSLLSFAESVTSTIMPIVNNLIYSNTLSSFPAACFILAGFLYFAALSTISTVVIHRHQ